MCILLVRVADYCSERINETDTTALYNGDFRRSIRSFEDVITGIHEDPWKPDAGQMRHRVSQRISQRRRESVSERKNNATA